MHLHRPDLSREGAAGTPGHDDGGEQDADLAQDGDAEQVDDKHLGAETLQLIRALIGENHPDEERDQADDGQRVEPDLLHMVNERGEPEPPWAHGAGGEASDDLAEEAYQFDGFAGHFDDAPADAVDAVDQRIGSRRLDLARPVVGLHLVDQDLVVGVGTGEGGVEAGGAQLSDGTVEDPRAGRIESLDAANVDAHWMAGLRPNQAQPRVQRPRRCRRPTARPP